LAQGLANTGSAYDKGYDYGVDNRRDSHGERYHTWDNKGKNDPKPEQTSASDPFSFLFGSTSKSDSNSSVEPARTTVPQESPPDSEYDDDDDDDYYDEDEEEDEDEAEDRAVLLRKVLRALSKRKQIPLPRGTVVTNGGKPLLYPDGTPIFREMRNGGDDWDEEDDEDQEDQGVLGLVLGLLTLFASGEDQEDDSDDDEEEDFEEGEYEEEEDEDDEDDSDEEDDWDESEGD